MMLATRESESQDSSPAPRPNARTSCDLCKRMKIKCERQGDTCVHCVERGTECETTLVERKKRQVKRVDPGSITEMENRIKRLEAVIVAAGIDGQSNMESSSETYDTPGPDTSNVTDRLSSLLIDDEGTLKYLGPSSGLSIFSPQGLQWISERTGNNEIPSFIKNIALAHKASKTKGKIDLWCPLPESARQPLPPKHLADQWVKCFFETFNTMLPLYDWDIFEQYYQRQYSDNPPTGPAWFASINVVLGIGGMIAEVHSELQGRGPGKENVFLLDFPRTQDSVYSKYFQNAASCFIELTFSDPSLMTVQALCGMAFLQQMSLEPHPSNVLTQTAGRMAYSIGLHKTLDEFGLSEGEINQRRNVFWIVYILDKALSLRLGVPGVMNDNDIGIDLPREHKTFQVYPLYPDGSRIYDIFRCQVQLAMLESRISSELYAAKAHKKSALERLRSVGRLDKDLQDWRMTVPIEIRPDEVLRCSQEQYPPVFLMHFEFFNCVSTIHRISIHHRGPWTKEDPTLTASVHNPQLNPRVYSSQSICLAAARSTIRLLQYIDIVERFQLDKFVWAAMYYPLSAFLLLFVSIIHNPEDPSAPADLQLMDLVIAVLAPMMEFTGPYNATATLQLCRKLRTVAKDFVEKKSRQGLKKSKRGHESDVPETAEYPPLTSVPETLQARSDPNPGLMPQPDIPTSFSSSSTSPQNPQNTHAQLYTPPTTLPALNEDPLTSTYPSTYPSHPSLSQQAPPPMESMGFPTLGIDAFMFSENLEWDLARMWDQEYEYSPTLDRG